VDGYTANLTAAGAWFVGLCARYAHLESRLFFVAAD
jgi:hypothetical protein